MKRMFLMLGAMTMAMPTITATTPAMAREVHHRPTRVYKVCRRSHGTAGLIAGGVAGAVVGGAVIGGGLAGPLVGAAGGALAGRAIDRSMTAKNRCRYYRR